MKEAVALLIVVLVFVSLAWLVSVFDRLTSERSEEGGRR